MNVLNSNSMYMLERSMDYLWSKQSCILNNLANVETPGYKTQYVTFEESLQAALQSAQGQGNTAQLGKAMREAIEGAVLETHEADDLSTRVDDNGVDITEQSVELSRNGYQLQYVMSAISSEFSILNSAISG